MKKQRVGRPTEWTEQKAVKLGNEILTWMKEDDENLFIEDFLITKGLCKQLISRLKDKYDQFNDLMDNAHSIQEHRLCKMGLISQKTKKDGELVQVTQYSSTFCMFLLKCNHGYMEEEKRQAIEMKKREIELMKDDDMNIDVSFDDGNGDEDCIRVVEL